MLKSAHYLPLRSYISLHLPHSYAFAAYNKRNFVPKIMKDPKFTREGIFKPRKKNYQYDLTQPHIQHPERYYNEEVDRKLERKAYRERRKERKGFEEITKESVRPLNRILEDLTTEDVLFRGSNRIILNINEIESHYSKKIDSDVRDIIVNGIRALNTQIHLKNLREVGIIASLNRKYGLLDKDIWNNIKLNLMKYFRREENDTIQLVNNETNESNFVHILNNVLQVSRKIDLPVADLMKDLEENYIHRVEEFKNPQNLILFTTALSGIPSLKKGAIWEKLDKIIAPHIKNINVLDSITLINTFAKAQVTPSFLDQLITKFVADSGKLSNKKVEKISVVAQALANLKKKDEKFNVLAEREVEANLNSVDSLIDCRFVICSFARLGIKSKKIFEHCANKIIANADQLSLSDIEQFVNTFMPKNLLPAQFFEAITRRVENILEQEPELLTKSRAENIFRGLDRWRNEKIIANDELLQKLRDHITYLG